MKTLKEQKEELNKEIIKIIKEINLKHAWKYSQEIKELNEALKSTNEFVKRSAIENSKKIWTNKN